MDQGLEFTWDNEASTKLGILTHGIMKHGLEIKGSLSFYDVHVSILSKAQECKDFKNHLNPVMLVFIGKLLLSSLRWVPYARVSVIFRFFASFCIGQISQQQRKD